MADPLTAIHIKASSKILSPIFIAVGKRMFKAWTLKKYPLTPPVATLSDGNIHSKTAVLKIPIVIANSSFFYDITVLAVESKLRVFDDVVVSAPSRSCPLHLPRIPSFFVEKNPAENYSLERYLTENEVKSFQMRLENRENAQSTLALKIFYFENNFGHFSVEHKLPFLLWNF